MICCAATAGVAYIVKPKFYAPSNNDRMPLDPEPNTSSKKLTPTTIATDGISLSLTKTFKDAEPGVTFSIIRDNTNYTFYLSNSSPNFKGAVGIHRALPLCQKLMETARKESPENFSLLIQTKEGWSYNCYSAFNEVKRTGSLSYGLWELSYHNDDEWQEAQDAYSLMSEGKLDEARAAFDSLIAENPTAENYYDRGFVYYRLASQGGKGEMTNLKNAETNYRKAIEIDPNFAPAYASLPNILQLQMPTAKYTQEMESMYEKAKSLDPGWSFSWMNKSLAYTQVSRFNEAYEENKKAVEVNPKFPDQERVIRNYICIADHTGKKEPQEFYDKYGITTDMLKRGCV